MPKRASILEHLEAIAELLPAPVYWEDIHSVVLGGNKALFKATGGKREAFIGKTPYELYPENMAAHIIQHNEEVMRTKETLWQEEVITDITTGEIKYFMAIKAPLYDDDGNVIGIVGTSVDISSEKEAERLKLENEIHQQSLQEQEKFTQIANKVAHDIRSPVASLLMIVKSCTELPEAERIALREAANGINDIANNLLNRYKSNENVTEMGERQPLLVSATLMQLLTDKKYEYSHVTWDYSVNQTGHFAFIKMQPSAFKRMISNLINNAVDACEGQSAKIEIQLNTDNEWVTIHIKDNGKGMSPAVLEKIRQKEIITDGKKMGHGIGLAQVRETLQQNQGKIQFESKVNEGTQITLSFPRITAPLWIAEEIKLRPHDKVIILDDDTSIHGAWDTHFQSILAKSPTIQLKHFSIGQEALDFILSLPSEQKQHLFLLTDFELLKQDLDGLTVIEKSHITRSILVTSHYTNPRVRERAASVGCKILPKQMASEIPIVLEDQSGKTNLVKVDLILIDDDKRFVKSLANFIFDDLEVACYYDPIDLLNNIEQYHQDTKILLDNNFATAKMNGIQLAQKLYERGYTKLYLLSGDCLTEKDLPSYLTAISKIDIDSIKKIK